MYVPHVNMKGWQGRVEDVSYDESGRVVYTVSFDSITMNKMSKKFIIKMIEAYEDFQTYDFLETELEATLARDTQTVAFATYRKYFSSL